MSDPSYEHPPVPASRRVNSYELLDEIGSGGMSRVYRARRDGNDGFFAIKVIRIEDVDSDFERRLRREPEVQRGLGHENIVQLFDWFRLHDEFFLVMELVEGRSLSQLIHKESGPLPFARARGYFRQMLRAVDHLHGLGIIHRDIKPGNVLVRRDDAVKLADFGIAKFTWQQGQTKTQKGLGTPEYMSPEQARGKQIDHRTDIYSLGITLFEMLTARKPFSRDEETPMAYVEIIQDILTKPLPDPRQFQPGIPPGVVRLLNKATVKDPNARFQTASELLGAIEMIDENENYSPATVVLDSTSGASESSYSAVPPIVPPLRPESTRPTDMTPRTAVKPPVKEPRRSNAILWIVFLMLLAGVGGYFGYQWYLQRQAAAVSTTFTDEAAMQVAKRVAADYQDYSRTQNPPALASLYAEKNVEYFKLKRVGRQAILDDTQKFYKDIASTEQFDVQIKKARAVNDSTIESEWIITYQRQKPDGTQLRGTASNFIRLERINGDWSITSQRQNWIKRDNVAPPIDTPKVVDIAPDTSKPVQQLPQQTSSSKQEIVSDFITMIDAGKADQAWETYMSSKMKGGDNRARFMEKFSGQHLEVLKLSSEGDKIVGTIGQPGGDGYAAIYRIQFFFVDEGGPKIDRIEVTTVGGNR